MPEPLENGTQPNPHFSPDFYGGGSGHVYCVALVGLLDGLSNTVTYFPDAEEHRLQGNPSGVRRRCFSASLKIRDRIDGIVY
jgi:hypothetical protein